MASINTARRIEDIEKSLMKVMGVDVLPSQGGDTSKISPMGLIVTSREGSSNITSKEVNPYISIYKANREDGRIQIAGSGYATVSGKNGIVTVDVGVPTATKTTPGLVMVDPKFGISIDNGTLKYTGVADTGTTVTNSGPVQFLNDVTISGGATMTGGLRVTNGGAHINGGGKIFGGATLQGSGASPPSITVGEKISLSGGIIVYGGSLINNGATIKGGLHGEDGATISGGVRFLGDEAVTVSGAGGLRVTNSLTTKMLSVTESASFGEITAPLATKDKFGIIKVGSNLDISGGTLSVPLATQDKAGVMTKNTLVNDIMGHTDKWVDGIGIEDVTSQLIHYAVCSTPATTAQKEVTIPGFHLANGAIIYLSLTNGHIASSVDTTMTLKVIGAGTTNTAKEIVLMNPNSTDSAISLGGQLSLPAGLYLLVYDEPSQKFKILNSPIESLVRIHTGVSLNEYAGGKTARGPVILTNATNGPVTGDTLFGLSYPVPYTSGSVKRGGFQMFLTSDGQYLYTRIISTTGTIGTWRKFTSALCQDHIEAESRLAVELTNPRKLLVNLGSIKTESASTVTFNGTANVPDIPIKSGTILPKANGGTERTDGKVPAWVTPRKLTIDISSTVINSFDGSKDVTSGITGILNKANGGTGRSDGKVDALVTSRTMDGVPFDGQANVTRFYKCNTAGNVVDKDIGNVNFTLAAGAVLLVQFANTSTVAPKLKVNGVSKEIRIGPILMPAYALQKMCVYQFVYDGSAWYYVGPPVWISYNDKAPDAVI